MVRGGEGGSFAQCSCCSLRCANYLFSSHSKLAETSEKVLSLCEIITTLLISVQFGGSLCFPMSNKSKFKHKFRDIKQNLWTHYFYSDTRLIIFLLQATSKQGFKTQQIICKHHHLVSKNKITLYILLMGFRKLNKITRPTTNICWNLKRFNMQKYKPGKTQFTHFLKGFSSKDIKKTSFGFTVLVQKQVGKSICLIKQQTT